MPAKPNIAKANKAPTDLGVLGLNEVKAALDKVKGPAVAKGNIVPDDFSHLTHKEKIQASLAGRREANDRFAQLRNVVSIIVKIVLANKLFKELFGKVLPQSQAKMVSAAIISAVLYRRWGCRAPEKKGEYNGPLRLPFFGSLIHMASHKHDLHDEIVRMVRNANFDTIEMLVPLTSFLIVMDARDREYILKTNPWNYLKNREDDPASFEKGFAEVLGRGIFATDKSEWLESRKIASHMFSGHALREQMEHVFNRHADRVVSLLECSIANTGRIVDMQEVFQCAVFDAFCEIAFGIFPNATDAAVEGTKPEFLVAFDHAQQIAVDRFAGPPIVWHLARLVGMFTGLGKEGELIKHLKVIDSYVNKIIDQRLAEKDISARNDLLSLYIKYSRSQSEPFSREDYRDIIVNFMIAGRDTTSCTLTYSTKFLGENQAVLNRLKDEGLFDLGRDTGKVSWDESKTIPFADAVVNEVLRMAPPVGDDFRICIQDDVLPSGLPVKTGSRVGVCNVAIGRDPFLWSNPDTFDPERWMKYDDKGIAQPVRRVDEYVHPIFFAGRRLCLGKDMARFETIVFMNKLFSRLKITALPNQNTQMVVGPVIFLKEGLMCKIETL